MATNFRVKRAKSFLFVALEFQNGLEYRHSDFKRFDDLATLCINLVKFDPVTPEFKIGKDVHPIISFFKINFQTNYLQDAPDRFSPNFQHMVSI